MVLTRQIWKCARCASRRKAASRTTEQPWARTRIAVFESGHRHAARSRLDRLLEAESWFLPRRTDACADIRAENDRAGWRPDSSGQRLRQNRLPGPRQAADRDQHWRLRHNETPGQIEIALGLTPYRFSRQPSAHSSQTVHARGLLPATRETAATRRDRPGSHPKHRQGSG